MKHLPIKSTSFNYIEKSFSEWLDVLGYSPSAIQNYPTHVRELFHYLEARNINHLKSITPQSVNDFLQYVLTRPKKANNGALSSNSIKHRVTAINLFSKYLYLTGKFELTVNLKKITIQQEEPSILTREEVKAMYTASYVTRRGAGVEYGQRDRAMLAVFYGCGLRKNEAIHLNITDLNRERNILHVRKGKGRKERLVPVTPVAMDYMTAWLDEGRHWFLQDHIQSGFYRKTGRAFEKKAVTDDEAFFIGNRGTRLKCGYYLRLQHLCNGAEIEKDIGLHTLRHSIATHLMQSGMDIEDIARFLGHASLDSTQIYTHISQQFETSNPQSLIFNP